MDKLRITLDEKEVAALCVMVKVCSNETFDDVETRSALRTLAERIKIAVAAQTPACSPILEELGRF